MPFKNCQKTIAFTLLALLSALTFHNAEAAVAPAFASYEAYYAVVHESADGTITLSSVQRVNLAGHPQTAATAQPAGRSDRQLAVELVERDSGTIVHAMTASSSAWLRGEFHGEHEIDGHYFPVTSHDYVIRVPVMEGTLLRVAPIDTAGVLGSVGKALASGDKTSTMNLARKNATTFDLPALSALTRKGGESTSSVITALDSGQLINNGSPVNRLDLLVVAEGYTAAQRDLFIQNAGTLADRFFSLSPYSDFRHLVNINWLFVPSNQSGADKPTCPETPGQPAVQVDTAFDGTFCTAGLRRLVTANASKVLAAAAAQPDWDMIVVLVNDAEYGGSGGSIPVTTTHPSSVEVFQHEFGHSFSRLADEYSTPYPGFPACSDNPTVNLVACEPNVTDANSRVSLKWLRWVSDQTTIPTTQSFSDPLTTGLWLGARYSTAMYRQCNNGIMRSLGRPFCHVDSEAFVKQLFTGTWGQPAGGINVIEPGATPAGAVVKADAGTTVAFQATLAGPKTSGALSVTWLVDNVVATTSTASHGGIVNFSYQVPDLLKHAVELRVISSTPLMLDPVSRSIQWTITKQLSPADYSDMWWAGAGENGWGMSIKQHVASDLQFNALYVYDAAGKPRWYVMPGGSWNANYTTFSGPLYRPKGAPLDNYNAAALVVGASPGSASINFTDNDNATLTYTIDNVSGSKKITRQHFGSGSAPLQVADMWWVGEKENGWGINIAQQGGALFSVWYTYGRDGETQWFVMPTGTWNGSTYAGPFYSTTGSPWLGTTYNPATLLVTQAGTMSLEFASATNATMSYTFNSGPFTGSQVKNIIRQPY